MKIAPKEMTIRDLTAGYEDNDDSGVVGYGGQLDIRPPYQREFIYGEKKSNAVIETVFNGFPLNVMYWAEGEEEGFEVIDGQQRTISICQYVAGDFAHKSRYFHNLQPDESERFLDYKLMVYVCIGNESEKLDWFKTINTPGLELTKQELRNAVYSGPWVTDAKRHFSKKNSAAYGLGGRYMSGDPRRQAYLDTVIGWFSNGDINGYMAVHQHDPNANELWLYFQAVIAWVQATYPSYRAEMKTVPWGELYNQFKAKPLNSQKLDVEVTRLMADEDVVRKKGIYSYLLDGKEKHLNIRAFSPAMRREAYERQKGICAAGIKHFKLEAMEADHIKPWHEGGKTSAANCQMLCMEHNRRKGGK